MSSTSTSYPLGMGPTSWLIEILYIVIVVCYMGVLITKPC